MSGVSQLKPRFHGNGFIQVYLNSRTRLHIWSPEFPAIRVQNAKIHSHRFSFTSRVLIGTLRDDRYNVVMDDAGDADLYDIPEASSKDAPLRLLGRCYVTHTSTQYYHAGDEYVSGGFRPDLQFHDANGLDGLCVTVMTKEPAIDKWARVVCKDQGEVPDHAFDNQPPQAALVAEVRRVMRMLI